MATQTKRYVFRGVSLPKLRDAIEPGLTVTTPMPYALTIDVTWDNAIATESAVDTAMRPYGFRPEPTDTTVLSPDPYLGIRAPDNSIWALTVTNLGVLVPIKVTL